MSVYERLHTLAISLPEATIPAAAYVPFVRSGRQVFVSGHIAKKDCKPCRCQLGVDMTTEQGAAAARSIAIDLVGTLQAATGDLEKVAHIVKLMVLVNSAPTYTEQHLVANGASQLLQEIFGERGAHARSAFGATQLPRGACVEIELIAELVDAA